MSFTQAISSGFSNYANFKGRATPSEYWWFALFLFLLSMVAGVGDLVAFGQEGLFTLILTAAVIVPSLAVGARRLHDSGFSGWWQLIGIIPFAGIIALIVLFCRAGEPAPNKYGTPQPA